MDRSLPYDTEAERATLGALLLNRDAVVAVDGWLRPGDFYAERHAWIFEAAQTLYRKRVPPDTATVSDELRRRNRLEDAGGLSYLLDLASAVPTSQHVEYYGRIVERTALHRRLIAAGAQIAALGYNAQDREPAEVLADAQAELTRVGMQAGGETLIPVGDTLNQIFDDISNGVPPGEPTGLVDYDAQTGGLHPDDLLILAGRPGHGKSSLALTVADTLAERGRAVLYFSLEMGRDQLVMRQLAMRTGVNLMRIRQYKVSTDELGQLTTAAGPISRMPLVIDDSGALTVNDVRTRTLRFAAEYGTPALVVVDYLQLMNSGRKENRVQEVSDISRGLKNLARELHMPVLALSQLNRSVEGRPSKVPILSDLRESGSLEQDADQVVFVYREELYDAETDKKGIAELHIAKHRGGPTGVVAARFDASTTRFRNLEKYRSVEGF